MRNLIGIKLTVLPDTHEQAVLVTERLASVMTGLAMQGIDSSMAVTPYTSEEEGT